MAIDQENLTIRLQNLLCCIGNLGGEIQSMIAVGNDCYKEKLAKLKILIGYLEAIECYEIGTEVVATGTITVTNFPIGETINVLVNGATISGVYTSSGASISTELTNLTNQINDTQSTYVASYTPGGNVITITSSECYNYDLTIVISSDVIATSEGLINGICSDNCITESELLSMFDQISNYCKQCFPNGEYKWTNSLIEE